MNAELTDRELQGLMIDADRGDIAACAARLAQQRVESARAEHKAAVAAPWTAEPSPVEVLGEMRLRGWSYEDARAKLKAALVADAKRIESASPTASSEIASALNDASEAKLHADNLLAERAAALDGLESMIYFLGDVRLKIRAVQSLRLDADGEKSLAFLALDFQLQRQGAGSCPATETGWQSSLKELTYRKTITPFLADYTAPLQEQAGNLAAEIRSEAKTLGVDLKKFMAVLAAERQAGRAGARLEPGGDYHGLW